MASERVKELVDQLAQMSLAEVTEVRKGLEDLFGFDFGGEAGTREPLVPVRPVLTGRAAIHPGWLN